MTTIRQQRVAEMLFQELSILISGELRDPRLSLVQVTHVDVSRDLRNVKVFVCHDDDEVSERQVLQGLKQATSFMRRQLALRCNLRAVPELLFYYDDSPAKAARVDALLRQIAEERERTAASSTAESSSVAGNIEADSPEDSNHDSVAFGSTSSTAGSTNGYDGDLNVGNETSH